MTPSIEQVFSARKPSGVAEVVVRARGPASRDEVWDALVTPSRWAEWAPHIARAVVDGARADRPVTEGGHVTILGPGPISVGARITLVEDGRWDFLARLPGPYGLASAHAVRATGTGAEVATRLRLTGPLAGVAGQAVLLAYAPLARVAMRRLVRISAPRPSDA